jgi:predicted GTPase
MSTKLRLIMGKNERYRTVDVIVDTLLPLLYVAHQDISSLRDNIYLVECVTIIMDRIYEKKKQAVEKFIRKYGKVDHSVILDEIDVDYDTLMKIISELRRQGHLNK